MTTDRWDETWHRLRQWTNGQAQSERLAAQILLSEGYHNVDPSHPLGGRDGGKDALCERDGQKWIMAVYFPRGQRPFGEIQRKLLDDARGCNSAEVDALAFVTNQELSLAERSRLRKATGATHVDLYHLERIAMILDKPAMAGVRKQFLGIDFDPAIGTLEDALDVLLGPSRDEHQMREAYNTLSARGAELLTRGVDEGGSRCTTCFSANVRTASGEHNGRSFDVTMCQDCGEVLDFCY